MKNIITVLLKGSVTFCSSNCTEIADALGVSRRNNLLGKAIDAGNKFPENCSREELEKFFAPSLRKRRIDAMTEAEERAAIKFWGDSFEVAPDTKSTCRQKIVVNWETQLKEWESHIKYYQYDTEAEILKKFKEYSGIMMGISNFHACKPWYIYPGPMNTCVCVKCLNVALIKKAARRYEVLLRAPFKMMRYREIIGNCFLSM